MKTLTPTTLTPTNALINVDQQKQTVDARELHSFLEVGKHFSTWMPELIAKYDFQEGKDYYPELGKITGRGRPSIEYSLTLSTAKEIAMVQNNDRGREARRYFIQCEQQLQQVKQALQAQAQPAFQIPATLSEALYLAAQQAETIETQQRQLEAVKPAVESFCTFIQAGGNYDFATAAKLLGTGRTRLFKALREVGVLMLDNTPYQRYAKHFEVKATTDARCGRVYVTTYITPGGLHYLRRIFSAKPELLQKKK
ncbi:antA/AntB antirepressor family protein [Cesiribacter andamanensis]|uniref:Phage anti-repressor protein n=1 Tax=Cesiribacter andamanensis AMV16 TaxID=1279009 RepID=M7NRX2_9BACT|nr:antA/AntB antirepressor family protein [Cesiribacter andamanensis]EMR04445.1 Phage anti-repressor protein [Cesiribacter andamanensis AMV16]